MHSFWQRLNTIFFFSLSTLGFFAFLAAGTTVYHEPRIAPSIDVKKIILRKVRGAPNEQAILALNIDADMTQAFNWNVKHLFLYITAEYETEPNVLNQVVIWDHIVSDRNEANIRYDEVMNKYSLIDQGYGLRGNNVSMVMNWYVIPYTGLILKRHAFDKVHTFQMPETYSQS